MTATPTPGDAARITRIARRRALPGHETQYESLVREMFTLMKKHHGYLGADLIPPERPGDDYQVTVNFATEHDLAGWDTSKDRERIMARMREHAEGEPEHRRLSGLEAWFEPAVVPASMHPPRHRMGLVTWMGIWPTASFFIWFLSPILTGWGLPFLLVTMINTALITLVMTYLVMPQLTPRMKWFLFPTKPTKH